MILRAPCSPLFPYTTLFRSLLLHYQPKVNMVTGEVLGFEALLRWQDPIRGLVPPGEFLPRIDRKSTRLNSSHVKISYAVFCLKKKSQSQRSTVRPSAEPSQR